MSLSNFDLSPDDAKIVKDATAFILGKRKERDAINAEMDAKRKEIKALGIDLGAWSAAVRRLEMDPEKREEFDRSFEQSSKALGVPLDAVQQDMFGG